MTIYFFVLGLLAILAAYPHQKSVKLQAILAVLLLVIFGGLRYKVGTDWYSYEHSFDAVNAGLPSSDFREEKGFLGLMSIVSYFGGTYGNFIFMLFTLSLAVKLLAVKSFKANINIALLVYFSAIFMIYDVNGLRQGLAMGLVLIAGFAAYQRRAILFACIIGIASSVHIVSLIGLMIYPMINPIFYKTSVPIRILLLMIGGIASFFLSKVILLSSLAQYLDFFGLGDHFNYYLENFSKGNDILSAGTFQRVLIALLVGLMIDRLAAPLKLKIFLYNCQALAFLLYFLFSFNAEFMARISFYFKAFEIISLALIFDAIKSYKEKWLYLIFLTTLAAMQIYRLLSIEDGGMIPYENLIWLN